MIEDETRQKYENKLNQLRSTLSPEQEKLFDDWLEVETLLVSLTVIENKTTGFQAGLDMAKELSQIKDGKCKLSHQGDSSYE